MSNYNSYYDEMLCAESPNPGDDFCIEQVEESLGCYISNELCTEVSEEACLKTGKCGEINIIKVKKNLFLKIILAVLVHDPIRSWIDDESFYEKAKEQGFVRFLKIQIVSSLLYFLIVIAFCIATYMV